MTNEVNITYDRSLDGHASSSFDIGTKCEGCRILFAPPFFLVIISESSSRMVDSLQPELREAPHNSDARIVQQEKVAHH